MLYTIWLFYTLKALPTSEISFSFLPKPIKNETKKKENQDRPYVKNEIKQEPTRTKRSQPMSAEMSDAKRPGLVTREQVKPMEEFERFASEDAAEEAAEEDPPEEEDDAVMEHSDEYQTLDEMINNAESSGGEGSSKQ